MAAKPKVVATYYFPDVNLHEELVTAIGAEFIKKRCHDGPGSTEEELLEATKGVDVCITNLQPYTRRVIESLTNCKLISVVGIGYDWVDVKAATEHGICVANNPSYCRDELSDHTMALLLTQARKIPRVLKAIKEGLWDQPMPLKIRHGIQPPMFALRGQTLGLIGLGNLARAVVPKAQGFGMKVIAFDPFVPEEAMKQYGVQKVTLDQLLAESDHVSLHCALTQENRHMLGMAQFKMMKRTAYIVNTARGPLIDEKALYTALKEGIIAGAAIDVVEKEPPDMDNPLFSLDNIIITPHMAQFSNAAEDRIWLRPSEDSARVLTGRWPIDLINRDVKQKFVAKWGPMKD